MRRQEIHIAFITAAAATLIAGCGGGGAAEQKPAGMPPDVQAEMQRRMGTVTGPGGSPQGGAAPAGGK